jgi:hypothetical protein
MQIGMTQVAKGKGPAYGEDPRSFRAEGYGMARVLLYLRLVQQQTEFKREKQATNTLICDNQGLLIRIEEALAWNYVTPKVTLRAEWDVEMVILMMHKELGLNFLFMHVKSHQDNATPVASLSLESRLNVEVDHFWTEYYMTEDKTLRPTVELFPSAKAWLIIHAGSVTRKIPQPICFQAGSIKLVSPPSEMLSGQVMSSVLATNRTDIAQAGRQQILSNMPGMQT